MIDLTVECGQPLRPEDIEEIEGQGLRIVNAIGPSTYRLRGEGTDAAVDALRELTPVSRAVELGPADKVDLALIHSAITSGARRVEVLVSLDRAGDEEAALAHLRAVGDVTEALGHRVTMSVDASRLTELADHDTVIGVETEPEFHTTNNVATGLARVTPVATDLTLDGSGEVVGVADSGLDTGDGATILADFAGRVAALRFRPNKTSANDLNNHGTHVTGSILGDGSNSNGNVRGMAPAAEVSLLAMGVGNTTGLNVPADVGTGVFADAYADGARLHSNSWGSNQAGAPYTARSGDVDEFMRDNPDMLIVFSAGNSGPNASTIGAPGTAKNCLTVGASESVRPLPSPFTKATNLQDHDSNPGTPDQNFGLSDQGNFAPQADDADDIAGFSSRGPTADGRIKPDIVAPGTWILSCRSSVSTADLGPDGIAHAALGPNPPYPDDADGVATHAEAVGLGLPGQPLFGTWDQNTPAPPAGSGANATDNYFYSNGTSMATPITTGSVALLRQYLRQQRGVANPSAALMKAMVVNGARIPAGQSNAPDNQRGFGYLDLEQTIRPAPTGQQMYSDDPALAVATGDVRSFSVAVADPTVPLRVTLAWTDAPGAGIQNQLYLRLVAPNASVTDGDTTPFPNVSNNVQRAHIANPQAGTYTVEVHGVNVITGIPGNPGHQDFSLAVVNGIGFSPNPVDIVQVIDRSGSMGIYGYMDPVKARASQLVGMLRVNDRAGVVAFNGAASTPQPVIPITGAAVQQSMQAAISTINAAGSTSIGGGLESGLAALTAGGDPGHPHAVVLLSDGHENTPPWVGGGVTDSPPSWYGGPNTTEVLPNVPAGLPVYTVSLGVQSDEVLLQEIATATGGVFHGIHSPADIGTLHEIYVHLQALSGGEEVIASGSDDLPGINVFGTGDGSFLAGHLTQVPTTPIAVAAPVDSTASDKASRRDREWLWRYRRTVDVQVIPVDETCESVTFMVSWHSDKAPVGLTVVGPNGQVVKPNVNGAMAGSGRSFQYVRLIDPTPGDYRMVVRPGRSRSDSGPKARSAYTWGAYADTSLGLEHHLPKRFVGERAVRMVAALTGGDRVRKVSMAATQHAPVLPLAELVEKYRGQLADVRLDLKPDSKSASEDLMRLVALDGVRHGAGEPSLFETKVVDQKPVGEPKAEFTFDTSMGGLHGCRTNANGVTAGGFRFQRVRRFSVRT